ncbi:MAG: hypothetical protein ABH825_03125 [Candidatus Omnitrophota bacterium]
MQASTLSATVLDPIKRSAKAKVMVKDGHTIAIGGLIDTSTTDTAKKVPGLSAIPIVGALFKSDTVQDTQTEVLIFITPHIIKSESDVIKTAKVAGQEGLGPGAPAEPVKQPYRGAEAEGEEVSIEDIADEAVRKEVSEIDRTVAIDRAVENLKEGRF